MDCNKSNIENCLDVEQFIWDNIDGEFLDKGVGKYEFKGAIGLDVNIFFKLTTPNILIDISNCKDIPVTYISEKKFKGACDPDVCIKIGRENCVGCKLNNYDGIVQFKASLVEITDNGKKAVYSISQIK